MRRYWLGQSAPEHPTLTLSGEIFHHAIKVVKHRVGERVELMTTDGLGLECSIESIAKKDFELRIIERHQILSENLPLDLFLCIPKIATLEWIIEKASELGVRTLTPVFSEFSFLRSEKSFSVDKQLRFKKIAFSAAEQSRRFPPLEIREAVSLESVLKNTKHGIRIFAYEKAPLDHRLAQVIEKASFSSENDISILIGSEGGFSESEAILIEQHKWQVASIGSQILRAETAAMYILSVLKYEWERALTKNT